MAGKEKFRKFSGLIKLMSLTMSITPQFLRRFLWDLSSSFSGIIALTIRYSLLRSSCLSCGDNIYIGSNVMIKGFHLLKIGNNVSIHTGCYLDASGGIEIEENVSIAHQSTIMSFNHTWDDSSVPIKYNPVVYKKVKIESDVWIGCAVRIMPGVTIHKRSVIAAGAVVVRDVESNTLVGGIPAKKIKWLTEQ